MAQWNSKKWARINWKNRPSTATALGATNLNKIDVFLNEVDNQLIDIDASKLNIATANSMIASLTIDVNSGVITAKQLDGTVFTWDLNLEKIPVSFTLSEDGVLTMTTEDGTQFTADIGELIKDYTFINSDTVAFTKTAAGSGYNVKAIVKDGSIKEKHLDPNYLSSIQQNMNAAQTAANDSLTYSKDSKRWAVGDTEYEGSEVDNSKYYSELSEAAKVAAEKARDEAQAVSSVEIATTKKAGIVKPDGVTITVDADGTIHGADTTDIATTAQAGIVKPDGKTIGVAEDGTISSIIEAASLLITDTQGLKVSAGKETTTQLLIDAIADKIANHIVTNETLASQLTNYITKSMITNQAVNDATKVTGAALSYAQQQALERLNSNLGMKITSGNIADIIGALPFGKYAGYYSSGATGTPSSYGTFEAIVMNDSTATITAIDTSNGTNYTRVKTSNAWKDWERDVTNSDLMIFGGAKSVAIATETNIVHLYFYTDNAKQNGYRIDANGITKRLSLLRIANGASTEICGVGMS